MNIIALIFLLLVGNRHNYCDNHTIIFFYFKSVKLSKITKCKIKITPVYYTCGHVLIQLDTLIDVIKSSSLHSQ